MGYAKGQSGNPAGKPKGTPNAIPLKIRQLCLKAAPQAIEELKRLMEDKNPMVRIAAAKELLDRGIGKAAQPIVGENGEGPVRVEYCFRWYRSADEEAEAAPPCDDDFSAQRHHEEPLPWQH